MMDTIVSLLPKLIHKFNAILIRTPVRFFELDQMMLTFIQNKKCWQNFEKEYRGRDKSHPALPYHRKYYKAAIKVHGIDKGIEKWINETELKIQK